MDWREIEDEKEKYAAYLCSREWGEKRSLVRERCGGRCERCFINKMSAVHHLTYIRKYGELIDDLQAMCKPCHDFTHGHSDTDPSDKVWELTLRNDGDKPPVIACPKCLEVLTTVAPNPRCRNDDHMTSISALLVCKTNGHLFVIHLLAAGGLTRIFATELPDDLFDDEK